jgi:hypothetical protein
MAPAQMDVDVSHSIQQKQNKLYFEQIKEHHWQVMHSIPSLLTGP